MDLATAPAYAFSKTNVEEHCTEEWTKRGELDKRMFSHCVRTETAAHAKMLATLKKQGKQSWMQVAFPAVWDKWTKRGITRYSLVAFSIERESDSFLTYEYEKKQPSFDAAKMSKCEDGHSDEIQWSQTMFCYKRD